MHEHRRKGPEDLCLSLSASPSCCFAPLVRGNQAGSSGCKFVGRPPHVHPRRVVAFHFGLRSRLCDPGPGLMSEHIFGVQVGTSKGKFERSFPYIDHVGTLPRAGCTPPTVWGSRYIGRGFSFKGSGICKQGRLVFRACVHAFELYLPLRPMVRKSPYSPGSGARGCSDVDAGVQVPSIMSRLLLSGDVNVNFGGFRKLMSSLHT